MTTTNIRVKVRGTAYHGGEGYLDILNEDGEITKTIDLGTNLGWSLGVIAGEQEWVMTEEELSKGLYPWPF